MLIQRVAVISDAVDRTRAIVATCAAAPDIFIEVAEVLQSDIPSLSSRDFDLYLKIDDGPSDPLPNRLRPAAWWLVDGNEKLNECLMATANFDRVFVARKSAAEWFGSRGLAAQWLPAGCAMGTAGDEQPNPTVDLCLMTGKANTNYERIVRSRFPAMLVANNNGAQGLSGYSKSRITASIGVDGWSAFDIYDAMASGSLVLINRADAFDFIASLKDGDHYASYEGPHELLELITFYLKRTDLRHRISDAGRRQAKIECNLALQMRRILDVCAGGSAPFHTSITKSLSKTVLGLSRQSVSTETSGNDSKELPPEGPVSSERNHEQWLAMIPPGASKILDLNCGDGSLGQKLKMARDGVTVMGVAPTVHEDAFGVCGSPHDPLALCEELTDGAFDCVLLHEWLARVENPAQLLRDVRRLLKKGGSIVVAVENIGYSRRLASLINGDWTYGTPGALDAATVNLFTRRRAEQWLVASGWHVRQVTPRQDSSDSGPHMTPLLASGLLEAETPCNPKIVGYLMSAVPLRSNSESTTIIVVLRDSDTDLRLFVRLLFEATRDEAFELLVVNITWDNQVRICLQSLSEILPIQIANLPRGTSFGAGVSEGVRRCRTSTAVLLSPDVRVSRGWLSRLITALHSDGQVECVGPRIGLALGGQAHDLRADYHAVRFAREWQRVDELSCACLAFHRQSISQLEWIYPPSSDDALTVARLSKAGSQRGGKSLIAQEVFVWSKVPTGLAADLWKSHLSGTGQWFEPNLHMPRGSDEAVSTSLARRIMNFEAIGPSTDPSAPRNLETIIGAELDRAKFAAAAGGFNCILVGEVLSYVPNALGILRRLRAVMAAGGNIRARVPNVSYRGSIGEIVEGQVPVANELGAVLPPLRFFTPRELEKLFFRAGFAIRSLHAIPNANPNGDGEVRCGSLRISGLTSAESERFDAEAYLVDAVVIPQCQYELTSILVTCGSNPNLSGRCIQSLRERTDGPFELIALINDGGAADFLHDQDVKVFISQKVSSIHDALGSAIEKCNGKHLVILSDSIMVTTGWLSRLLRALNSDASIGVVGPCSNAGDGVQHAPPPPDASLLDGFAWEWGKTHDRMVEDVTELLPLCLLFLRSDLNIRQPYPAETAISGLIRDGRRAVVALDSYVYYTEQSAQASDERPRAASRQSSSVPSPRSAWGAIPFGKDMLLRREPLALSLCMIVRDSARTLGRCLRSIRPWVSEMIVVDTGSVDDTPELARRLGARVYHFPWCCDFAAARNESLRHARGQWIFWMDADDTIDPSDGQRLSALAAAPVAPAILGYVIQVHCPGAGRVGDVTVVDHVKLFRNRPDLRFYGRIHEQILPSIRRAQGEVEWTNIYVTHSGADYSVAGRHQKFARDVRLLQLELRDRPNHSFTLFNLGMTHGDVGEHAIATDYLRRSLHASHAGESHVRKIYALLAASLSYLDRHQESYDVCMSGIALFAFDAELNFRAAIASHRLGNLPEAERLYSRVLKGGDSRHFSSIDWGIAGFKANYNLAAVYLDMGRAADAEAQYVRVTELAPNWPEGWRALINLHIDFLQFDDAERALERSSAIPSMADVAADLKRRLVRARQSDRLPFGAKPPNSAMF